MSRLITPARWALRLLVLLWLTVGAVLLLPGCGGGDFEDEDARAAINPPACAVQPEVCR
jgi:hypothetical protein